MLRVKDQGETKDEPRNYQRTPKPKKCVLLILSSLSPFLYLASKHRANTERRPREERINSLLQKALFLIPPPKKVD